MNSLEFDRFLHHGLCWLDGVPTISSHAGQRQCPHCRRKWSYDTLRRQWALAKAFCKGLKRKEAAREAGTDAHTAGRHYRSFQTQLSAHFAACVRDRKGGIDVDPEELSRCCRQAMRAADPRKKMLLMVDLCLRELSPEARLDLLYRLGFRERIQKLTRSALASRLSGR